jgi:hypothetical protein
VAVLWKFLVALLAALLGAAATAAPRSRSATAEFQRATPCPSTDARRGRCPGYVIDHVVPLCAGGADAAVNMQWQTIADAKVKDREEIRLCRERHRGNHV